MNSNIVIFMNCLQHRCHRCYCRYCQTNDRICAVNMCVWLNTEIVCAYTIQIHVLCWCRLKENNKNKNKTNSSARTLRVEIVPLFPIFIIIIITILQSFRSGLFAFKQNPSGHSLVSVSCFHSLQFGKCYSVYAIVNFIRIDSNRNLCICVCVTHPITVHMRW